MGEELKYAVNPSQWTFLMLKKMDVEHHGFAGWVAIYIVTDVDVSKLVLGEGDAIILATQEKLIEALSSGGQLPEGQLTLGSQEILKEYFNLGGRHNV